MRDVWEMRAIASYCWQQCNQKLFHTKNVMLWQQSLVCETKAFSYETIEWKSNICPLSRWSEWEEGLIYNQCWVSVPMLVMSVSVLSQGLCDACDASNLAIHLWTVGGRGDLRMKPLWTDAIKSTAITNSSCRSAVHVMKSTRSRLCAPNGMRCKIVARHGLTLWHRLILHINLITAVSHERHPIARHASHRSHPYHITSITLMAGHRYRLNIGIAIMTKTFPSLILLCY